jgi:hypothetical protein
MQINLPEEPGGLLKAIQSGGIVTASSEIQGFLHFGRNDSVCGSKGRD